MSSNNSKLIIILQTYLINWIEMSNVFDSITDMTVVKHSIFNNYDSLNYLVTSSLY